MTNSLSRTGGDRLSACDACEQEANVFRTSTSASSSFSTSTSTSSNSSNEHAPIGDTRKNAKEVQHPWTHRHSFSSRYFCSRVRNPRWVRQKRPRCPNRGSRVQGVLAVKYNSNVWIHIRVLRLSMGNDDCSTR